MNFRNKCFSHSEVNNYYYCNKLYIIIPTRCDKHVSTAPRDGEYFDLEHKLGKVSYSVNIFSVLDILTLFLLMSLSHIWNISFWPAQTQST